MTHHRPRPSAGWPAVQMIAHQVNQQVNRDTLRVGDAEREEAARQLGDHFAAGRLDPEEYDERLEAAFAARTGQDLQVLFRDLPQQRPVSSRPVSSRPLPSFQDYERTRGHHGFRFPFLPLLFLLIGTAIITGQGWIVWVGLGVLLLAKKLQWERQRARRHRARASVNWP
jgi:hypothetical protein